MTPELRQEYDVVVIGGGMAALSLARLLHLELPEATLLCLDKGSGPGRKVGESTVEIAGHFVHQRLQLHQHLVSAQLPKNGIRYWFDSAEHDYAYHEASEDGPASFSWWHTYQLERETLEGTLLELNRASGSHHLLGVREIDAVEGSSGEAHTVSFTHDGQQQQVRARWLVDGSGPGSKRGRQQGLLAREGRIPHGACWAWFKGARSPEELMGAAKARRFCFGKRLLSTNSYMAEGYWVWMIPLASGLMSVGLVYDQNHLDEPPKSEAEFEAFLKRHRMLAEVVEGAELSDFQRMDNFAYKPDHYLATNRTAWIGTAAGFVDPLYSSGLDFIAIQCEYLVELLRRERGGEAPNSERVAAYNRFLELYFEQTVRFFSGLYKSFVSQELVLPRYRRDVHIYWNLYTWPYFSRQFLDPEFLRGHERVAEHALERSGFFTRLFEYTYELLKERGQLFRSNRGVYTFNQLGYRMIPFIRFERQMGHAVPPERRAVFQEEIDTLTFLSLVEVLYEGDRCPMRSLLYDALHGGPMAQLIALEEEQGLGEPFWLEAFRLLSERVSSCLSARGIALVGELTLTRDNLGRLPQLLEELACDEEAARQAKAYYTELPALDDLPDLPPIEAETMQDPITWGGVTHTPWDLGETVEPRTVYEFLGEGWWNKPVGALPNAVWGVKEELETVAEDK